MTLLPIKRAVAKLRPKTTRTQRNRYRRMIAEHLEVRELLSATHPFPLSALDGNNGFRIDGIDISDGSGSSVSDAGDVNGDGLDDLIIGAYGADPNGITNAGESYVVFGRPGGFPSVIALSSLDAASGFRIEGIDVADSSGASVSSAGDINGDGLDDLIIGARYAAPGGRERAGESYVLFGKSSGFGTSVSLSGLNGSNGFRIDGVDAFDHSGIAVSGLGDITGDGLDDLIISAFAASPGGNNQAGRAYVLFGKSTGFSSAVALSSLVGSNGFRIDGIDALDQSGYSVSSAGDINGDGLDDLIIGAVGGDPNGILGAGESYVVFGKSNGFSSVLALSSLNGTNGFRIDGIDPSDFSGRSVSTAGDINGDGFDDLIIGANTADAGGNDNSGESYVIFGKPSGYASAINLSSLNGTNGFRIDGVGALDYSGRSVSSAGDVNGDGFDDLLVGAPEADPEGRVLAGESYLLFGKPSGFTSSINLSSLDGTIGFRLEGIDAFDRSGRSTSNAGDVNGDGFSDIIIGARTADPGGNESAGESYVVFGGNFTGGVETQIGGDTNDTLVANQGIAAVDRLIGGRGNDTLVSDGGPDVLIGGQGDDILEISDVDFISGRRILGGNGFDTLRLNGSGLMLDLTAIRENRIVDIEQIDISGSGNNSLNLNRLEVLNLSSHSNTLIVRRNLGDTVEIGAGWVQQANEVIGQDTFEVFARGAARLKIQIPIPAAIVGSFVNHVAYTGSGSSIDTGKVLAKETENPTLLNYDNLVNAVGGIRGLSFDIQNLPGIVTASDFVFQVSPTGEFDQLSNPVNSWAEAPNPASISVNPGGTARVTITWQDESIVKQWLRVTVLANSNTGLAESETYYIGHLLGETTGPSGPVFTVSFADITPIRNAVGSSATANSTVDIDKNGIVSFNDITAMRTNISAALSIITIPASGGGGAGMMSTIPGPGESHQEGGSTSTSLNGLVCLPLPEFRTNFAVVDDKPRAVFFDSDRLISAIDSILLSSDANMLSRMADMTLDMTRNDRGEASKDFLFERVGQLGLASLFENVELA